MVSDAGYFLEKTALTFQVQAGADYHIVDLLRPWDVNGSDCCQYCFCSLLRIFCVRNQLIKIMLMLWV